MRKPCCDQQDKNKGAWSKQEDQKLIDYILLNGEGCWRSLPQAAGLLRCGKSCRLRWINYLRPDLKRGNFAEDEEDLIIKLHALLGNRWSLIAGRLPGRTDNEVKNYWNSHLRKKLMNMGIDPNNHRLTHNLPRLQIQKVSTSAASSGSKHQTRLPVMKIQVNNDQLSDAGSSSLEDDTSTLPDLNLDLTINLPSPSPTFIEEAQKHVEPKTTKEFEEGSLTINLPSTSPTFVEETQKHVEPKTTKEFEEGSSPTLLLFT